MMKQILILVLLAGCSTTKSEGSQAQGPEPVVANVSGPQGEHELRSAGFALKVFEGGPANLSLEAENESMRLVVSATLVLEWTPEAVLRDTFPIASGPSAPAHVQIIQGEGEDEVTTEGTEGTLNVKMDSSGQADGTFETTMSSGAWSADLAGNVSLLCMTKQGKLEQRGGAPDDGSDSWWLDEQFETEFCQKVAKSFGVDL